jgi:GTP-binding protein
VRRRAHPAQATTLDTGNEPISADEAADGIRLMVQPWQFEKGVVALDGLPPAGPLEIAVAGRSNVGKSSLINALTGCKGLARASNTPGRTQEINFFRHPTQPLYLVDLPGYGFAKAPKSKVDAWTALIKDYLRGRPSLGRVLLLIDARHGLKSVDRGILELLNTAAVSFQVVVTKSDKIAPSTLSALMAQLTETLRTHPAAFPTVLATSSETGAGIDALRAALATFQRERAR